MHKYGTVIIEIEVHYFDKRLKCQNLITQSPNSQRRALIERKFKKAVNTAQSINQFE